jgi:hypothetical protein
MAPIWPDTVLYKVHESGREKKGEEEINEYSRRGRPENLGERSRGECIHRRRKYASQTGNETEAAFRVFNRAQQKH